MEVTESVNSTREISPNEEGLVEAPISSQYRKSDTCPECHHTKVTL